MVSVCSLLCGISALLSELSPGMMQIGVNRSPLAQGEDAAAGTPTLRETS